MKIALFLANAGKNSGGPEVYEVELLRALARLDRKNEYHVFFLFERGPETVRLTQDNVFYHVLKPKTRAVSLSITLPLALRRLRPDAIHSTFIPPAMIPRRMAYTLPCTAVFARPHYYPALIRLRLQALCGLGIRKSQAVVCISQHVQDWMREEIGLVG